MKRLTKIYSVISAAMVGAAMLVVPAGAEHTPPLVVTCLNGDANVQTDTGVGLTVLASAVFEWDITGRCDTDGDGQDDATLSADGYFADGAKAEGRCGQSTASGGKGTITFDDPHTPNPVTLTNIGWVSAGSVLEVTGNHDHGGTGILTATVQASPQPSDACLASPGAKKFAVTIAGQAS